MLTPSSSVVLGIKKGWTPETATSRRHFSNTRSTWHHLQMGKDLARQADDAVARVVGEDSIRVTVIEDMPAGDNLATVRAAWEWLNHFRAQATYYEDAARRTGYERAAERHHQESEAVDLVRNELRRMWMGDDVITPSLVDELRREVGRLNYLIDRVLGNREDD